MSVLCAGALGGEREMVEGVQAGTLDWVVTAQVRRATLCPKHVGRNNRMQTEHETSRQTPRGYRAARAGRGFSLIEVMIVVAIIGILAAIAMPSYSRYVTRSKLPEAFSVLSGMGLSAQRFFQDNRTYADTSGVNGCPPGVGVANGTSRYFNFTCTNVTATTITMTATGIGDDLTGITFTLNQDNARATPSVPSGWTSNSGACWVRSQGGDCS